PRTSTRARPTSRWTMARASRAGGTRCARCAFSIGSDRADRRRESMQTRQTPFLPPRWFIRGAWAVHRALYAISGGRFGLRKPTAKTYGMLRIHTTGRRTGVERVAILGYFEAGTKGFPLALTVWGDHVTLG